VRRRQKIINPVAVIAFIIIGIIFVIFMFFVLIRLFTRTFNYVDRKTGRLDVDKEILPRKKRK